MPEGMGYPDKGGSITISKQSITVTPEARKRALKKALSKDFPEETA